VEIGKVGAVDQWRVEIALRVGHGAFGPFLLPLGEAVSLGRADQCGLRVDHPAVSRHLATLAPSERGWILENGRRTRVRAESPFVLEAVFAPGSHLLLQPADWTLRWDLDVLTHVTVRYRRGGHGEPYPVVHDNSAPEIPTEVPQQLSGTAVAADHLNLTDLQRRRLGALFAYLIEGRPKPDQLIQTAAKLSGDSISQINGTWVKVMEYLNRHRDVPIERIDDLGYHLVEVAGLVGPEDVPVSTG
jgi:hypothetical protein